MARRSKSELETEDAERDKLELDARLLRPPVKELIESMRAKALQLYQSGERTFDEDKGGQSHFLFEQTACVQHGVFPFVFGQPHGPPKIQPILTQMARAERQAVTPIGVIERRRYMTFRVDMLAARKWRDAHFMFWMDTFERFPVGLGPIGKPRRQESVVRDRETLAMLRRLLAGDSLSAIGRTIQLDRTAVYRRLKKFCDKRNLPYPSSRPSGSAYLEFGISPEDRAQCDACEHDKAKQLCRSCPWNAVLKRSKDAERGTRERIGLPK